MQVSLKKQSLLIGNLSVFCPEPCQFSIDHLEDRLAVPPVVQQQHLVDHLVQEQRVMLVEREVLS